MCLAPNPPQKKKKKKLFLSIGRSPSFSLFFRTDVSQREATDTISPRWPSSSSPFLADHHGPEAPSCGRYRSRRCSQVFVAFVSEQFPPLVEKSSKRNKGRKWRGGIACFSRSFPLSPRPSHTGNTRWAETERLCRRRPLGSRTWTIS